MRRTFVLLVGVTLSLGVGFAQAGIIKYKLLFFHEVGPQGVGEFVYESCETNLCPRVEFEAAFSRLDPDLIFDQVLLGGGADGLLGFFSGDVAMAGTLFPGFNLASLAASSNPISNLLSFESAGAGLSRGIYCIRPTPDASGLCRDDPSVTGIGTWVARRIPVPEPHASWLIALGMILLGFVHIRRSRL